MIIELRVCGQGHKGFTVTVTRVSCVLQEIMGSADNKKKGRLRQGSNCGHFIEVFSEVTLWLSFPTFGAIWTGERECWLVSTVCGGAGALTGSSTNMMDGWMMDSLYKATSMHRPCSFCVWSHQGRCTGPICEGQARRNT